MRKVKIDNIQAIPLTQYIEELLADPEAKRMLDSIHNQWTEMNEYIERIEDKIQHFKNSGPAVKIEIMHDILADAESFIDYYTEE